MTPLCTSKHAIWLKENGASANLRVPKYVMLHTSKAKLSQFEEAVSWDSAMSCLTFDFRENNLSEPCNLQGKLFFILVRNATKRLNSY